MMKYNVVRIFCCCLLLVTCTVKALALSDEEKTLLAKNFTFLYMLEASLQKLHPEPAFFTTLRSRFETSARDITKNCTAVDCFSTSFQFSDAEIISIGNELVQVLLTDEHIRKEVQILKARGPFPLFRLYADTLFIRKAWEADARGINHILSTYIEGHAPLYPKIDSISFNRNDPAFREKVAACVSDALKNRSAAFFSIPLLLSVKVLVLNGRDEAARYEPLIKKDNAAPYEQVKKIKWKSYPYSVILVPGLGPEQPDVKLDPGGARRCDSAAIRYRAGLAPFIVVSGGHVHPNKTPYCEAVEMKKYLVEVLHIPAAAIIIEPHARHTTTNLRNTNRILYHFKLPASKPVLIVTDAAQNGYINGIMKDRVVKELGYIPFSSIKKISNTETEYIPSENSRQINSMDPLDP
jgi:hypothetical protein